jgi:hypothetical protein
VALTPRRVLAIGAVLAVAGLLVGGRPVLPLYDGVINAEPYRYLDPAPGQPGSPPSATATVQVINGGNDLVAVATGESVPQAQLFVIPEGLTLPSGTTRIDVSIAAVEPPGGQPADGHIAGNVYAFDIANQAGAPISAKAEAQASVELRAPDQNTQQATIERWTGTAWEPVPTTAAGLAALFTAVVSEFGDFAIVLPGPAESGAASGGPTGEASGFPASSGGGATEAATSAPATPGPTDNRGLLTLILGGVALAIVVLVAAVAFLPSRGRGGGRKPPPRSGGGRGAGRRR